MTRTTIDYITRTSYYLYYVILSSYARGQHINYKYKHERTIYSDSAVLYYKLM